MAITELTSLTAAEAQGLMALVQTEEDMREVINKLSIEILPTEGRLAKNVDAVTLYFSAEVDNISTNVFKSNNPNIRLWGSGDSNHDLRNLPFIELLREENSTIAIT